MGAESDGWLEFIKKGILGQYREPDWATYRSRLAEIFQLSEEYQEAREIEINQDWFDELESSEDFQKAAAADPRMLSFQKHLRSVHVRLKSAKPEEPISLADALYEGACRAVPIVQVTSNWSPFLCDLRQETRARLGPETFAGTQEKEVEPPNGPVLPDGVPAVVTLRVAVNDLTQWDIGPVLEGIEACLRAAFENRPTYEEAPNMARTIPSDWLFLLHCHEKVFRNDVERYKLCRQGLKIREIAYLEQAAAKGKPIDVKDLPRPIGSEVPGESSVRASVKRIYHAVYHAPFYAGRRRLDAPAQGVEEYACPEHGRDCPETCEHLKHWWELVERTLPTSTTGKGKGEVLWKDHKDY